MILGLASSGLHSNGYSLVRKIFSKKEIAALQKEMLTPTRLYTKPLLGLQKKVNVKGIAHITGGAYIDKIPRIIPEGLCAEIKKASWPIPKIFKLIQEKGNVEEMEMYRVFNMGIGMVVVIPPKDINAARSIMARSGINSWVIGTIINGNKKVRLI
jgi:phosphoribosylformylglycinamidine cyclo-ligase